MPAAAPTLPSPPLTQEIEIPAGAAFESLDLKGLPASPGLFVFENESGGTLALAQSANVRRLVRSRLAPPDGDGPSRRIDYRSTVRRVRALRVGSVFEADWAYLQLARVRTPTIYASLLDHWRGWFIHVNPETEFPRFTKTSCPFGPPQGTPGHYFGPLPDKHAAGRYLELLDDAFDLCRYHHILIESPHASPCVYKEMGRCPAPCDGTITLAQYREQISEAAEFARTPIEQWRETMETNMREAGERRDFDAAAGLKLHLERTAPASRADLARVRALEAFRYLAIASSDTDGRARLFIIRGGWIEPLLDVALDAKGDELRAAFEAAMTALDDGPAVVSDGAIENIGMVCWHLFRRKVDRRGVEILPREELSLPRQLGNALRRVAKAITGEDGPGPLTDQVLDTPGDE